MGLKTAKNKFSTNVHACQAPIFVNVALQPGYLYLIITGLLIRSARQPHLKKLIVTGSNGLIGSEGVAYFDSRGGQVFGADNNMRADFFGEKGDTRWNQHRLEATCKHF